MIRDFFVDKNGRSTKAAALWTLTHVAVSIERMGLGSGRIVRLLTENYFVSSGTIYYYNQNKLNGLQRYRVV